MKVNVGEIVIKKTEEALSDKEWIVLNSIFYQKDLAVIFNLTPSQIGSKYNRSLKRYEEIEHPVEQGQELLKAMDTIVERGRALQNAGVQNEIPELGLLAQISVWTVIDIIKDLKSTRQDKLRGASDLRKWSETAMGMKETFLKTEAMGKIIEILKEIIGQLSPPLQEEFAKRVAQDEGLRFLLKGF